MEITITIPGVAEAIYALASSVASLGEVLEGRIPTVPVVNATFGAQALVHGEAPAYTAPTVLPAGQMNPQTMGGIVNQAPPAGSGLSPIGEYVNPAAAPTQFTQPTQPLAVVPTTPLTYTLESLAKAATQLVDAGRRDILVGLLSTFGIPALTALPQDQYGNFASHLRANGAQI